MNIEVSEDMITALQEQNVAILQLSISNSPNYREAYGNAGIRLDSALSKAAATVRDLPEVEKIHVARQQYLRQVNSHDFTRGIQANTEWYIRQYSPAFNELMQSVNSYVLTNETSLQQKVVSLEERTRRSLTPAILTMAVVTALLGILLYLLNLYYIKPILRINRSLQGFLRAGIPFDVKTEGCDEVHQIKESIADLITAFKNKKGEQP